MARPVPPDLATDLEPLLDEGIAIFNEGRHWHAHEAWEVLWKQLDGEGKEFVQGLIMAAAMLVHYDRPNPVGVAKHWQNVQDRLPKHAPSKWGVDVAGLLAQLKDYVTTAADGPHAMTLDPGLVQIERVPQSDS